MVQFSHEIPRIISQTGFRRSDADVLQASFLRKSSLSDFLGNIIYSWFGFVIEQKT